ncbi:MAG: hemerythrin family protein [Magnetococcales bacterium]|nr:hemerythrin family protein [Magnetococcales bacterium]
MITEFHQKLIERLVDVRVPRFNLAHEQLMGIIIDADVIIGAVLVDERSPTQEEWDALSDLCDELARYTKSHFDEEVGYLFSRGYPHAKVHQDVHQALIEDLNIFKIIINGQHGEELKKSRKWLLEWLLNHVNHEDNAYAKHFSNI